MRRYVQKIGLAGFFLIMSLIALAETETSFAAMKTAKFGKNPADKSDIVGRDLNVPLASFFGHVGLWTGSMVIEALNQTPAIVLNTLQDFKSRSTYWGAIYYPHWNALPPRAVQTNIRGPEVYANFYAKDIPVQRAFLIKEIGADYNFSPFPENADPQRCMKNRCVGPKRGKYRCDSFVKDTFMSAGTGRLSFQATDTPSTLWNTFSERR